MSAPRDGHAEGDDEIVSPYLISPRGIVVTTAVFVVTGLVSLPLSTTLGVGLLAWGVGFGAILGLGSLYVRRIAVKDGMWPPEAQRRTRAHGRR